MTALRLDLEGAPELIAALENMSEEIAEAVSNVVMETAANIETEVKLKIQQGPATGRVYRRGEGFHRASAAGEAPASDSGDLMGSIYHVILLEKSGLGTRVAEVGSRMDYAAILENEFGSFNLPARPAWLPVIEAARPEFRKDIEAALAREIL